MNDCQQKYIGHDCRFYVDSIVDGGTASPAIQAQNQRDLAWARVLGIEYDDVAVIVGKSSRTG